MGLLPLVLDRLEWHRFSTKTPASGIGLKVLIAGYLHGAWIVELILTGGMMNVRNCLNSLLN